MSLTADLLKVADRHKVDHEIYHVARDVARWSQQHVHELAEVGKRYGLTLTDDAKSDSGLLGGIREKASEVAGRRPEPGLLLLADLCHLHRVAAGGSLDLGAARAGRAGRQGLRAAGPDPALPPAVAAPDAMGQRHAQSDLPPDPYQLISTG